MELRAPPSFQSPRNGKARGAPTTCGRFERPGWSTPTLTLRGEVHPLHGGHAIVVDDEPDTGVDENRTGAGALAYQRDRLGEDVAYERQAITPLDLHDLPGTATGAILVPGDLSVARETHVLWVDDNPENNAEVVRQLEGRGVAVMTALNTAEAVSRYDPAFDVVDDCTRILGLIEF